MHHRSQEAPENPIDLPPGDSIQANQIANLSELLQEQFPAPGDQKQPARLPEV
jgi:hypothetical protein